jgi:hypothetical protein
MALHLLRRHHPQQMIRPAPQPVAMSPTFLPRKLLGSSLAGTSLPAVTELLAFSHTRRVRITLAQCLRLRNTPLLTTNLLTLPTSTLSPHPRPSSHLRMASLLPTTFPPSPHSLPRSQSHRHLRSSCTSVTLRRSFRRLYRFRSTLQGQPYLHLGLMAQCPLSLPRTHIPVKFPLRSLDLRRLLPIHLLLGRNHPPPTTHDNLPLRTSASLRGQNKMVHKSRLYKKASAIVAIVVQAVVQVSDDHHSAVASQRACSSLPAVVGMGMALLYSCARLGLQLWCRRDECRFPHVMPDGHIVGRVSRFRSPPQNALNGNGHANLEEKLASLSITEVSRLMVAHFHVILFFTRL